MLKACHSEKLLEAGCDEAGRGCLAGPVYAAAVILPKDYNHSMLNDSKHLSLKQREYLRKIIEKEAIAWAFASVDENTIDRLNILNASILAMHRAIDKLGTRPEFLLIDGNRFKPYPNTPHYCVVRGDAIYQNIAAASILAKTYRDDYMRDLDRIFPEYSWKKNKGYPTLEHRKAILNFGITEYHRKSFRLSGNLNMFHPTEK